MPRDPWERIVGRERAGIYESNYLKANSRDGTRGIWLKHNLLRPLAGPGKGEFWAILFERGKVPRVVRRDVAWEGLVLAEQGIGITAGEIALAPDRARGAIAGLSWDLRLSGGLEPILHLPYDAMYTGGFPKKKLVTPAPNLRFDGRVEARGETWEVDGWVGLRGHNWGTEHAWRYAYGNCNLWDDGAERAIDGFTAQVRLGPVRSPWLSSLLVRNPDLDLNRVGRWLGAGEVTPGKWSLRWDDVRLEMEADPSTYVGLRYGHPDGRESCCYNTKFARVRLDASGVVATSDTGELEVLFPEPLPDVVLHPTPEWDGSEDYASGI